MPHRHHHHHYDNIASITMQGNQSEFLMNVVIQSIGAHETFYCVLNDKLEFQPHPGGYLTREDAYRLRDFLTNILGV